MIKNGQNLEMQTLLLYQRIFFLGKETWTWKPLQTSNDVLSRLQTVYSDNLWTSSNWTLYFITSDTSGTLCIFKGAYCGSRIDMSAVLVSHRINKSCLCDWTIETDSGSWNGDIFTQICRWIYERHLLVRMIHLPDTLSKVSVLNTSLLILQDSRRLENILLLF